MRVTIVAVAFGVACSGDSGGEESSSFGTTTGGTTSTSTSASTSTTAGTTDESGGLKLDVQPPDLGGPGNVCKVADDGDAPAPCTQVAPPGAFEPEVQWAWLGADGDEQSMVIPLVANVTDDNGDDEIDLCDTPDILVLAFPEYFNWSNAKMYALDGATGQVHWKNDTNLDAITAPALGDIDGDGLVEIVAVTAAGELFAMEHDGTTKWTGDASNTWGPAVAIADLDGDGSVEIFVGSDVYDSNGTNSWTASVASAFNPANTAADLDGDGDLEIVMSHAAVHHDGSVMWEQPGVVPGYPAVADFDGDGKPEVLTSSDGGLFLVEGEDGALVFAGLTPNGDAAIGTAWRRPATVHDFDGDGDVEFAVSSADHYGVFTPVPEVVWSAVVDDSSGTAAGTAFDFLGDAEAEAMYADELNLFVYDGSGTPLLTVPRSSGTGKEYPVVADVDNDGSAEIVVVSNASYMGVPQTAPGVQVIRDIEDRWIPARRIWNQHTYHVTNVREDGTIPAQEPPHWMALNTFRTQAQINPGGGGVCQPEG